MCRRLFCMPGRCCCAMKTRMLRMPARAAASECCRQRSLFMLLAGGFPRFHPYEHHPLCAGCECSQGQAWLVQEAYTGDTIRFAGCSQPNQTSAPHGWCTNSSPVCALATARCMLRHTTPSLATCLASWAEKGRRKNVARARLPGVASTQVVSMLSGMAQACLPAVLRLPAWPLAVQCFQGLLSPSAASIFCHLIEQCGK